MPHTINNLSSILNSAKDTAHATAMSAYMKNMVPFLGIPAPQRKILQKSFILHYSQYPNMQWEIVHALFKKAEREFHYIAIDYISTMVKKIMPEEIPHIEQCLCTHSWWDTVDSIAPIIGNIRIYHPSTEKIIEHYIPHPYMWLRRVAIIHQLRYKNTTNTALLSSAILANTGTQEFFINKAIGWALREYAKTNSEWVLHFLQKHENILSTLSIREAKKHL